MKHPHLKERLFLVVLSLSLLLHCLTGCIVIESGETSATTASTVGSTLASTSGTTVITNTNLATTTTATTTAVVTTDATTTAATTTAATTTAATTTAATTTAATTTAATTTAATTTAATTTAATTTAATTTAATTTAAITTAATTTAATTTATKSYLQLISVSSPVNNGSNAKVEIVGKPNTEYEISVYYSTTVSTAKGLEPAETDSNGKLSWSWKVGINTSSGSHKIVISGGGETIETYFETVK